MVWWCIVSLVSTWKPCRTAWHRKGSVLCTEPLLLTVPDTPWAIFMVCVSEWYLPVMCIHMYETKRSTISMHINKQQLCPHDSVAAALRHLLSLPFIMASNEPMPRYFFTFTPFCSKYSPAGQAGAQPDKQLCHRHSATRI
jgi:hypothetical protein